MCAKYNIFNFFRHTKNKKILKSGSRAKLQEIRLISLNTT